MTRTPRQPARHARTSLPLVALLAAATVAIGGCAAKGGTFGDEINSAGEEYTNIGERWEDGNKQVAKGRKLVRRGKERMRDGEDDVEDGEELIRKGQAAMNQSKRDYERLRARSPAAAGPAPGS